MAENGRNINTNPLIGIVWFFVGVIMEWFAVMIQKAKEWERIAHQYPNVCGAAGIGGWTLLIFFVIFLIALVIYLINELFEITDVPNRTEETPKIKIIGKNMEK